MLLLVLAPPAVRDGGGWPLVAALFMALLAELRSPPRRPCAGFRRPGGDAGVLMGVLLPLLVLVLVLLPLLLLVVRRLVVMIAS